MWQDVRRLYSLTKITPAFQNTSGRPGAFCKGVNCSERPAEEETGDYITVSGCWAGQSSTLLFMSVVLKVLLLF